MIILKINLRCSCKNISWRSIYGILRPKCCKMQDAPAKKKNPITPSLAAQYYVPFKAIFSESFLSTLSRLHLTTHDRNATIKIETIMDNMPRVADIYRLHDQSFILSEANQLPRQSYISFTQYIRAYLYSNSTYVCCSTYNVL